MTTLRVISITYKQAGLQLRGKFVLSAMIRSQLYSQLKTCLGLQEALVVSTCNRTEIHYVSDKNLKNEIIRLLYNLKGMIEQPAFQLFESIEGQQAIHHLFRLAIGLESQILGDIQIYGQIKQAYQESADHDMAQTMLHRLMHQIFATHKQVCQLTNFKEGTASVAYEAINTLRQQKIKTTSKILVVGTGKIGTSVAKHLLETNYAEVTISNRTDSKAEALASELCFRWLAFSQILENVKDFDVVISAAGAEEPIFDELPDGNIDQKIIAIDLCAPCTFSKAFIQQHISQFFGLDEVSKGVKSTMNERVAEIAKVEQIINTGIAQWQEWQTSHLQTRKLAQFKQTLEALRQETMANYLKKIPEEHVSTFEEISKAIIGKIVKLPALQLKQACERDRAETLGQTLNELFNLEIANNSKLKAKQP